MSYYPKGHHTGDDAVDDFDEYDPTPYDGGYDITVAYGRPIPPSEETCYPISSSTGGFDYERPHYASSAEPSAYADEALDNEYKSYAPPKPRPTPSSYGGSSQAGYGGSDNPRPSYGFQSGINLPVVESEFGDGGLGSEGGYGRKPEHERPASEYGSGYGRDSTHQRPSSEYGSGYGRKSEYQQPNPEYQSGYGRKTEYDDPASEYGSGHGRRHEDKNPSSNYGSGYGRSSAIEEPVSEYGSTYGRRPQSEYERKGEYEQPGLEYESGRYGRKPSYGQEEDSGYGYGGGRTGQERAGYGEEKPSYGRSSYNTDEIEGHERSTYDRPSYKNSEEDDYRKPSYQRRDDDDYDEGYGRKKYGDDDSNEEDSHKHHHRHHRKHYDD